jgi:hypothetical protein
MERTFARDIAVALGPPPTAAVAAETIGDAEAPSCFAVTDIAAASIGAAALEIAGLVAELGAAMPAVVVDRRLATLWFGWSIRPIGWEMPSAWDSIAGDYRAKDGWIKLHTNAPHHRAAALRALGVAADRAAVADAVSSLKAGALEAAIVAEGGCAAQMRSIAAWAEHPQGQAVAAEPLILWSTEGAAPARAHVSTPSRPLAGVRVLDLTRVIAGPVAGRFLAAYGAEVLRIDPPDWDEPGVIPEVTLGKRCAGLDLRRDDDRARLRALAADADILLHGYRPGALEGLGLAPATLRADNPALIDVSLCAYGWSGPWAGRRGFDSLVQLSAGVADHGMRCAGAANPVSLPVQALDHATGYLIAAAAIRALRLRAADGAVRSARLSLARTAHLLTQSGRVAVVGEAIDDGEAEIDPEIERGDFGPCRRVRFPASVAGAPARFDRPASALRSSPPQWS